MLVLQWKKRALCGATLLSIVLVVTLVTLLHVKIPIQTDHLDSFSHHVHFMTLTRPGEVKVNGNPFSEADLLSSALNVPRVTQHCNLPRNMEPGVEGQAPQGYNLTSVYVIIRHGDSTSMTLFRDLPQPSPSCSVDSDFLQSVPELRHFLQDMEAARDGQLSSNEFSHWSLYPSHAQCDVGQLTGQGALQLLMTGLALRKKYVENGDLFSEELDGPTQLDVRTTHRSLAYQSAVSLLYGLLPQFNFTKLPLRAAENIMFCNVSSVPSPCCSRLSRSTRRRQNSPGSPTMAALADIADLSPAQLSTPGQLAEVLTGWACHGLPLPCGRQKKCVTPSLLQQVWRQADSEGLKDSQDVRFDRYCRAIAHSLLLDLSASMLSVLRQQSRIKLTLFSGHELTLTSVLQALGMYEGRRPVFAARLVLELYQKYDYRGDHFIRFVYNGKDVTSRARFCRGRTFGGMCRFRDFRTFVERDNLADIRVRDWQSLNSFCKSLARF